VIPVRNDAERLRRCLASIRRADYPPDRVEIVVADNGSTDGSAEVAAEAGGRVLSLPHLRVAELRNLAAAATTGAIVAFVDADHEIGREWIQSAVDTLRLDRVGAAGAPYSAPVPGTWVQRHYDRLRRREEGIHDVRWLASGNVAIWRETFDRMHGFDTSLHTCEDVDLSQRMRAAGVRVVSDSRLTSTHFGDPSTLREVFAGELWRGRDNLRVSLRRPVSARSLLGAAVPLAELGFAALGIVGLALGSTALPLAGLGGMAALGALQSYRMLQAGWERTIADLGRTFAVASVYSLARALAIVMPVSHRIRHSGTISPSSQPQRAV
jgi:hypothetical protein